MYHPISCTLTLLACLLSAEMFGTSIQAQDYTPPRGMGLPDTGFERPDPIRYQVELSNNLVAYIVEEKEAPLVTVTAFVRGGTASDETDGSAEALARAFQRGPGFTTANEFTGKLQKMVADYRVNVSQEMMEISLNVPSEHMVEALQLVSGILREPAIDPGDIEAIRAAAGHERRYGNGPEGARSLFEDVILRSHIYDRTLVTDEIRRLSVKSVQAFHSAHFVPGNVVLALSGAFVAQDAQTALNEHFGDWQGGPAPKMILARPVNAATTRQIHTYALDTRQAWIALGHEISPVSQEARPALDVMNYILGGGHFDTRLFRATRDQRGLTNDASGFPEPGIWGPGIYPFLTSGRHEVIPLLVDLVLQEIDRIRSEPVYEEELFVAIGALVDGSFQMLFEDGHATARTFAQEWIRYRHHRGTEQYPERVRAITAEDVLAAANKYLDPERLQLVIVGPIDRVFDAKNGEGGRELSDFGTITQVFENP